MYFLAAQNPANMPAVYVPVAIGFFGLAVGLWQVLTGIWLIYLTFGTVFNTALHKHWWV